MDGSNSPTADISWGSNSIINIKSLDSYNTNVIFGRGPTAQTGVVWLGKNAGNGGNSVAIGLGAGQNHGGQSSIFIGQGAGAGVGSGVSNAPYNTAIGHGAGANLTTGDSNIIMGPFAGRYITTGRTNIVIGSECAQTLVTGSGNILIGEQINSSSSSGSNVISIGGVFVYSNPNLNLAGFITGDSNLVTISGNRKLVLATSQTPASASAAGTTGQVVWDSSFIYVCIATNIWKRVSITTW